MCLQRLDNGLCQVRKLFSTRAGSPDRTGNGPSLSLAPSTQPWSLPAPASAYRQPPNSNTLQPSTSTTLNYIHEQLDVTDSGEVRQCTFPAFPEVPSPPPWTCMTGELCVAHHGLTW